MALPASISVGDESCLVWDTGLGTLLDQLALPLRSDQGDETVAALIRRLLALRYLVHGEFARAAAAATSARELLSRFPEDRTFEKWSDPESQFAAAELTDVQENFVAAHELAHHLANRDRLAFDRFDALLDSITPRGLRAEGPCLFGTTYEAAPEEVIDLLDTLSISWEYALQPWTQNVYLPEISKVAHRRELTRTRSRRGESSHLREEMTCDTIAAMVVASDTDRRPGAGSIITGVAVSMLALANYRIIAELDCAVTGQRRSAGLVAAGIAARMDAMQSTLPVACAKRGILRTERYSYSIQDVRAAALIARRHVNDRLARIVPSVLRSVSDSPEAASVPALHDQRDVNSLLEAAGFEYRRTPYRWPGGFALLPLGAGFVRFPLGTVSFGEQLWNWMGDKPENRKEVFSLLDRHVHGDWGDAYQDDIDRNEEVLRQIGLRRPVTGISGAIYSSFRAGPNSADIVVISTTPRAQMTRLFFISEA